MVATDGQESSIIEWVVLGLVVLAIFSIGVESKPEPVIDREVTHLSGMMNLSTQSSLEMFSLDGYDRYPPVEIEIDSQGVVSEGCTDCTTPPTGVHMNGTIVISNLTGGPLTRVEGRLDFTHLSEHVTGGFISREWRSVDWGAGSISGHWEILIVHDPPKWSPDNRTRATFIPVDGGDESRTGPWIFVETLLDHALSAQGCLPDSSRCVGFPSRDINLTATREPVVPPTTIQHPDQWVQLEVNSSTNATPTMMEDIRGLMDLGEQTDHSSPWCHSTDDEIVASGSWEAFHQGGVVIAPMSTWLEALALPSSTIIPSGGTWSEVETEQLGCASLVDENGLLRLGISVE